MAGKKRVGKNQKMGKKGKSRPLDVVPIVRSNPMLAASLVESGLSVLIEQHLPQKLLTQEVLPIVPWLFDAAQRYARKNPPPASWNPTAPEAGSLLIVAHVLQELSASRIWTLEDVKFQAGPPILAAERDDKQIALEAIFPKNAQFAVYASPPTLHPTELLRDPEKVYLARVALDYINGVRRNLQHVEALVCGLPPPGDILHTNKIEVAERRSLSTACTSMLTEEPEWTAGLIRALGGKWEHAAVGKKIALLGGAEPIKRSIDAVRLCAEHNSDDPLHRAWPHLKSIVSIKPDVLAAQVAAFVFRFGLLRQPSKNEQASGRNIDAQETIVQNWENEDTAVSESLSKYLKFGKDWSGRQATMLLNVTFEANILHRPLHDYEEKRGRPKKSK